MVEQEFKFRKMEVADIDSVLDIEEQSFTTPWNRMAFIHELTQNHFAHYIIAMQGDNIIGYCGMWLIMEEAHITNVAILPDYRGYNYGEKLMRQMMLIAMVKGIERMTLEVRVSNIVAQKLYEKLGFVVDGRRPRYYSDNQEDALIMWVELI